MQVIALLVSSGADVELPDQAGRVPWELLRTDDSKLRTLLGGPSSDLFEFASSGDVTNLTAALCNGAKANARNKERDTLLHAAVRAGKADIVQLLLSHPDLAARPHAWQLHNTQGMTPLHTAAENEGSAAIVTMLLNAGAGVDDRSFSRSEYAAGSWESEGRELRPDDKTALHVAVEAGASDVVDVLLARGADPGAVDFDGATPLGLAVEMSDAAMVSALLRSGAAADGGGICAAPPLHAASSSGAGDLVELLLVHGADPNRCASSRHGG